MNTTKSLSTQSLMWILPLTLVIGLALGYLIFRPAEKIAENHDHHMDEGVWTCSMHPQIREDGPGACPICAMDLVPASSSSQTDPSILEMTPEAVKLSQIETTKIGEGGSAEKQLILSGKIQADERLAASQAAHIPGRIEKLYVSFEGERIRKGQRIALIYSPILVTAQQELLEALKFKDSSPGLLQAARKKLAFWKISQAQIDSIEKRGVIQENFVLFADVSGIVTKKKIALGDHVSEGDILFEIMNLDRLWVIFDAYEEDLAHIKVGNPIQFTVPALPGQTFTSRISFIDPVIHPRTRVAAVRTEINNRNALLKPEMFVRGNLTSKQVLNVQVMVPRSAVLWTGERSVVYVKVPQAQLPSFQYREVLLGERVGENYQVKEGLELGEEVVSHGSFVIDAAAQLNNQRSMMNRNIGMKGVEIERLTPQFDDPHSIAFRKNLLDLVHTYFPIKDALIESDSILAQKFSQIFLQTLKQVQKNDLGGEARTFWEEQEQNLLTHITRMTETSQLEGLREPFYPFSQALIESLEAFGAGTETLYVQHCPMAFDFNGADWLSKEEEILNPYFGDVMLTCGNVKQVLTQK